MEENIENMDLEAIDELQVPEEIRSKIECLVKKLREDNPKLRMIYPVVIEGSEFDDKDWYIALLRQPTFKAFSKYLTMTGKTDIVVANRALAKDCFLDGDEELISDDSLFMFGLMPHIGNIIQTRQGKLVNLSKPGK